MSKKSTAFLRAFKNIFLLAWYRFFGKLVFPLAIIPKSNFQSTINIRELHSQQDVYILRRSNLNASDSFNEMGILREDALKPKDIPFLSLNLLGGEFESSHCKVRTLKKGNEKWTKDVQIFITEFMDDFELLDNNYYCPIYIYANNLQDQNIPYSQPVSGETRAEVLNFFEIMGTPEILNNEFQLQGTAELKHDPTFLNYWHVEYNLYDYKGVVIKFKRSSYIVKFCQKVIGDIICVNASPNMPMIPEIPKSYYITTNKRNFFCRLQDVLSDF